MNALHTQKIGEILTQHCGTDAKFTNYPYRVNAWRECEGEIVPMPTNFYTVMWENTNGEKFVVLTASELSTVLTELSRTYYKCELLKMSQIMRNIVQSNSLNEQLYIMERNGILPHTTHEEIAEKITQQSDNLEFIATYKDSYGEKFAVFTV